MITIDPTGLENAQLRDAGITSVESEPTR